MSAPLVESLPRSALFAASADTGSASEAACAGRLSQTNGRISSGAV